MAGSELPHWHLLSRTTTGLLATDLSEHSLGPGEYEPPIAQYVRFVPRLGSPATETAAGRSTPKWTVPVPCENPPNSTNDRFRVTLGQKDLPYRSQMKSLQRERSMTQAKLQRSADIATVKSLPIAWAGEWLS